MNQNRFEIATQYLIDLLRAYGHRPIIVKISQDGEVVEVMARTFVKRQLTAADILFPFDESNKKCTRFYDTDLDDDELSILFHQAVFELEEAYIEQFCQDKPEAESYINSIYGWIERKREWLICTFSYYNGEEIVPFPEKAPESEIKKGELSVGLEVLEEDVESLQQMGFKQISSLKAMMQVFWTFASYRQPIGKLMKNAILSITVDEDAADYLIRYNKFYNSFIQARIEDDAFPQDNKKQKVLNELSKKHKIELDEQNRKWKDEIAQLKKRHQEELHDNALHYKARIKEYETIIEKFRRLVLNPNGRINQAYDLTNEKDIRDFISWFKAVHKKVKNQIVKWIVKERFADNEEAAELFKRMVEEYNSTLLSDEDTSEESETKQL